MAVTIHLPQVHQPNIKRLAFAGVAVLATAATFFGVQAITNNTDTAGSTSDGVVAVRIIDTTTIGGLNPAAAAAGIDLSTPSLNPAAAAAGIDLSAPSVNVPAAAVVSSLASTFYSSATAADTQTRAPIFSSSATATDAGTTAPTFSSSATVPDTQTRAPIFSSSATATDAVTTAPTFSSSATVPEATGSTVADWSQFTAGTVSPDSLTVLSALGFIVAPDEVASTQTQFDPYPESGPEVTLAPRSNFGSDIDWLVYNGWTAQ